MYIDVHIYRFVYIYVGSSGGTVVHDLPTKAGEARAMSSIPGSGRSPEVDIGNPLQCSCLENSMDRGAWQATVHGVMKTRT